MVFNVQHINLRLLNFDQKHNLINLYQWMNENVM